MASDGCRKVKYFSEETAQRTLEVFKYKRRKRKIKHRREERTYKCPKCGYWHMTSIRTN